MVTHSLAILLLLGFIVISESSSRTPGPAKKMKVNGKFQLHTFLYLVLTLTGIALGVLLLIFRVGYISNSELIGWIGIALMILAIFLRTIAMNTLGKYHTRSLITLPNQPIIQTGIYKYIRHPGYLGSIIGGIGFAIATTNWLIMVYAAIALIVVFHFRIVAEEKMMLTTFGAKYKEYSSKTKRLVPFIF